jgi:hypothetical protein
MRIHSLFFQVLIDAMSKYEGIVTNLIAFTGINQFVFTLRVFWNVTSTPTNMLLPIVLLIIVYYIFDMTIYTCLPHLEVSPLCIGR